MFQRAAMRFLENLDHYHKGEPIYPQVDYNSGY
jgi:hypothetical protein